MGTLSTESSASIAEIRRRSALVRVPAATYRLQLHQHFTLPQVGEIVEYLHALGVSDCYCSPILMARKGSSHGYDICDHSKLNPELGEGDDLARVADSLRERGMGLVVDFVPNHMGIDPTTNAWWRDVLENGPSSSYATYFDIDWTPIKTDLRDKVLLPILGGQYGEVLERGELQLGYDSGTLIVHYFDRTLPINPRQLPIVFGHGLTELEARLGHQHPDIRELRSILSALTNLPTMSERDEQQIIDRNREKQVSRERLAALVDRSPEIAHHVHVAVAAFNGEPGTPRSFDLLHGLLEVQAYRLAYWRTAFDEINYRRFFDINDLAGLRIEDPRVFSDTHTLLLNLVADGTITGIRIDHPDGLFDPAAYFATLHTAIAERLRGRRVYTVAEKILARGERLREEWAIDGTTGYNSLNTLNGLFIHPNGLVDLRRVYRRFASHRTLPADTGYTSKKFMMRTAMASELNVLTRAISRLAEANRRSRDFTLNGLRRALIEVVACFPAYRTYVTARGPSPEDEAMVDTAIGDARRRNPVQEPSTLDFLRHALLPRPVEPGSGPDPVRDREVAFACKFQQYTAPVVAKGLEDTAFYRDVLLLSANEVGGDLRHRTRSITEFHAENWHRLTNWPFEMTAAATHDTKRGEDARARINALTECVDEWRTLIRAWAGTNESARLALGGAYAPDRNDEWMFYQALVGAWPAEAIEAPIPATAPPEFVHRMQGYMVKAVKEAKRHTSWLYENVEYEQAVSRFVQTVLAGPSAGSFLASFVPFQRRIAWYGMLSSLSQLVLRFGAPGVPDTFQGTELWNLSLVDPDNRRPVDFSHRRRLLADIDPLMTAAEAARVGDGGSVPTELTRGLRGLLEHWPDGRAKLYTMAMALRLRRAHPDLFLHGEYQPLGSDLEDPHLIAYSRRLDDDEVVVIVPRYFATLLRGTVRMPFGMECWRTTSVRLPARLASARFVNVFTGEHIEPAIYRDVPWLLAGSAFQNWPAAILWLR